MDLLSDFITNYGETFAWIAAFFMCVALAKVAFGFVSLGKTFIKRIKY